MKPFLFKPAVLAALITIGFGAPTVNAQSAAAQAQTKSSVSKKDSDYIKKLAQTNIAEIEAAKLAQSKSKNDQVLEFSKHMIDDHTNGLNDVKKLADAKGVQLPSESDKAHKKEAAKLSMLDGEKFDKAYLTNAGLKDHQAAKNLATTVAAKADDSELKALAEKMNETINMHLKMVEQVVRK